MNARLRKFISYYGKYKAWFFKVMLCALISSGASLLIPLCAQGIARLADAGEDILPSVIRLGFLMLGLLAVEALFNYYYDYHGHALGARMESDLRAELFSHLEGLSFRFFDERRVGVLMSSLTNDMLDLTELFHHGPEDYLMNIVRLIGASAILLTINARLALAVLLFVPPLTAAILFWGSRIRRVSAENQARVADINARAADVLGGIRTVQAYANEREQEKRFGRAGERFYESRCRVYKTESYADKTTLVLVRLTTVAVVFFGGLAIAGGSLDLAGLIAFLMYVGYVTEPIQHLSWMVTQYQMGMAGFDRVMELLETQPEIADMPGATNIQNPRGEIELRDITFSYGDGEAVLDGLSLSIPAGQFVALVGMSGEGKSTLGALLPRFYEPQSGTIRIDGEDIRSRTLSSLRASVALVQQDAYLFDDTIASNIGMGRVGADREAIREAARKACADEFLSGLPNGYDSLVGERGVKLSGGQRQRVGIARALLKDAPILVLDEATSALDNETERRVYDSIRADRAGRTTIVIAHRLSTVREAERIVVLQKGKIVEDGTHDGLMRENGVYAKLYSASANDNQ